MGDLSEHFSKSEFSCRDNCGFDKIDMGLVQDLEDARSYFNASIHINDGCRCEVHNKAVGGVLHSQHVLGTAADITVQGFTPDQVADYLESAYPDSHGIGRYNTFTHFDNRANKSRWDFRT